MKLELQGIKKSFDGTEILHGINFSVEGGSALGLLGRNGAGKTTTVRIHHQLPVTEGGLQPSRNRYFRPETLKKKNPLRDADFYITEVIRSGNQHRQSRCLRQRYEYGSARKRSPEQRFPSG